MSSQPSSTDGKSTAKSLTPLPLIPDTRAPHQGSATTATSGPYSSQGSLMDSRAPASSLFLVLNPHTSNTTSTASTTSQSSNANEPTESVATTITTKSTENDQ